jgi:hypothetical protein
MTLGMASSFDRCRAVCTKLWTSVAPEDRRAATCRRPDPQPPPSLFSFGSPWACPSRGDPRGRDRGASRAIRGRSKAFVEVAGKLHGRACSSRCCHAGGSEIYVVREPAAARARDRQRVPRSPPRGARPRRAAARHALRQRLAHISAYAATGRERDDAHAVLVAADIPLVMPEELAVRGSRAGLRRRLRGRARPSRTRAVRAAR